MKSLTPKRKWLIGIGIFVILFIGLAITAYIKVPHPADLGQKLEYIGKRDYGCVLFWCESTPSTEYYFATDMSEEELKEYFKGAKFLKEGLGGVSADYAFDSLNFEKDGDGFSVNYYHGVRPSEANFGLRETTKPHVISLSDYELAKSAL